MTESAKMQRSCVIGSYGANLFGSLKDKWPIANLLKIEP